LVFVEYINEQIAKSTVFYY